MELGAFVTARRPRWEELERLLDAAEERGLARLTLQEARLLSRLYRGASRDLLWVRGASAQADLSDYLNDLVARSYALTYPGERLTLRQAVDFLLRGFPELFARELPLVAAAVLLFGSGALFGWLGMAADPDAAAHLIPGQHQSLDPLQRAEAEAGVEGASLDQQAAFSSFLFTHNLGVAFFAFALGATAGVGTAVLLFFNGVSLGSLAWLYSSKGLAGWFWAWILPHGIPEITAICIAGAAGLVIARGLVAPGGLTREQALRAEGRSAIQLLLGTVVLFVLAGLIEGTISQIHPPRLSVEAKLSFAGLAGAALTGYLSSAGWRRLRFSPKATRGSP